MEQVTQLPFHLVQPFHDFDFGPVSRERHNLILVCGSQAVHHEFFWEVVLPFFHFLLRSNVHDDIDDETSKR